ncbi:hypothetical protein NDU88_004000 [Pleurodeles waltl]|uniref:Uncharacterized protein n=1 Tax=Pleurodeles waltl TaxID=8319 RepID=A0AAV7UFB0_PLEWA|nr:hypothetical protein NDU88_004000 [Pleurodeles waltl]
MLQRRPSPQRPAVCKDPQLSSDALVAEGCESFNNPLDGMRVSSRDPAGQQSTPCRDLRLHTSPVAEFIAMACKDLCGVYKHACSNAFTCRCAAPARTLI